MIMQCIDVISQFVLRQKSIRNTFSSSVRWSLNRRGICHDLRAQYLGHTAATIPVFPLMLTQGAKKLISEAQQARIADSRKVALRPSM